MFKNPENNPQTQSCTQSMLDEAAPSPCFLMEGSSGTASELLSQSWTITGSVLVLCILPIPQHTFFSR